MARSASKATSRFMTSTATSLTWVAAKSSAFAAAAGHGIQTDPIAQSGEILFYSRTILESKFQIRSTFLRWRLSIDNPIPCDSHFGASCLGSARIRYHPVQLLLQRLQR